MLAIAESGDLNAYNFDPAALIETGARIVAMLVLAAAPRIKWHNGIARTLQSAWAARDPAAERMLRAALILLVDHELAVSSFSARCVASATSPLYAVVEAGLCALRGIKHGGATERAEEFLREASNARNVRNVIEGHLRMGEQIPGFGHQLYPQGDPRAHFLLEMLARRYAGSPAIALARSIMKETSRISDRMLPNIDFAGAVLAQALRLPPGSAISIFALGRSVGWIGHAIEQYRIDRSSAVAGHAAQPDTFYMGSVGGGLWKTENSGRTWFPIADDSGTGIPIGSIGAIAVAPSDPNIVYVGTGEPDIRSQHSYGIGVFKSTDAGKTWRSIGLAETRQIGKIVIDPADPDRVYVAALGHVYKANPERGVYRTTDGGSHLTTTRS